MGARRGYDCPDRTAELLAKHLPDESKRAQCKVIDVGSGTGLSGAALKKLGFANVVGTDISQVSLDLAMKKERYMKVVKCDANKEIPFAKGHFDACVCVGTTSYLNPLREALLEILR